MRRLLNNFKSFVIVALVVMAAAVMATCQNETIPSLGGSGPGSEIETGVVGIRISRPPTARQEVGNALNPAGMVVVRYYAMNPETGEQKEEDIPEGFYTIVDSGRIINVPGIETYTVRYVYNDEPYIASLNVIFYGSGDPDLEFTGLKLDPEPSRMVYTVDDPYPGLDGFTAGMEVWAVYRNPADDTTADTLVPSDKWTAAIPTQEEWAYPDTLPATFTIDVTHNDYAEGGVQFEVILTDVEFQFVGLKLDPEPNISTFIDGDPYPGLSGFTTDMKVWATYKNPDGSKVMTKPVPSNKWTAAIPTKETWENPGKLPATFNIPVTHNDYDWGGAQFDANMEPAVFTITFINESGPEGSVTWAVDVKGRDLLPKQDTPKHRGGAALPQGLYASVDATFEGWYKGTALYDFGTEVRESFTLTAKWKNPTPVTVNASGDDILARVVNYVSDSKNNNGGKTWYFITTSHILAKGKHTHLNGSHAKLHIIAAGSSEYDRTIQMAQSASSLVALYSGAELTVTNVNMVGLWNTNGAYGHSYSAFIYSERSTFIMDNSVIREHYANKNPPTQSNPYYNGGAVNMRGGTFIMKGSSKLTGNGGDLTPAALNVADNATIKIIDGEISNNRTRLTNDPNWWYPPSKNIPYPKYSILDTIPAGIMIDQGNLYVENMRLYGRTAQNGLKNEVIGYLLVDPDNYDMYGKKGFKRMAPIASAYYCQNNSNGVYGHFYVGTFNDKYEFTKKGEIKDTDFDLTTVIIKDGKMPW